ncbi:hypothetical protein [Sodalis sp. dw_96]|uniref:hypothetical protein n=1 Tax=Sodalis sp. dw_96 TaxID=2719794 RepID=UPI001BD64045|nr:hypothetical protein [Sodalis sp. dw_96]
MDKKALMERCEAVIKLHEDAAKHRTPEPTHIAELEIYRIALAALEAEPIKRVNAHQMQLVCLEATRHIDKYDSMANEVNKLLGRTTPPAASRVPDDLSEGARQFIFDWLDGCADACRENDPEVGIFPNYEVADEIDAFRSQMEG